MHVASLLILPCCASGVSLGGRESNPFRFISPSFAALIAFGFVKRQPYAHFTLHLSKKSAERNSLPLQLNDFL